MIAGEPYLSLFSYSFMKQGQRDMKLYVFLIIVFLQSLLLTAAEPSRRILYLLTSLESNDWEGILHAKWKQLHQGLGPSSADALRMIGFSRRTAAVNGTWSSSHDGTTFQQVSNVSVVDLLAWKAFVSEHYVEGATHLVIGTISG